ncbi:uncharacterized protein IWZ02DRAFT_46484 [Phyllosticta citriasiana]|uniref:uncharacterized protein n=1 Tax=Phyllosticta citriasiana TaxID=595635 RepID=UPI0030FDC7B7
MARKKSTLPLSVRQRDNQRRSRAQQKEHVAQLQQKLLAFDRRGVQATAAVQQAARAVADENRLLRELLARRGVLRDEVDEFLSKQRRHEVEGALVPGCSSGGDGLESTTSTTTRAQTTQTSTQSPISVVEPVAAATPSTALPHAYDRPANNFPPPQPHSETTGQEMSCAEAAAIMAAMRGGQHHGGGGGGVGGSYDDDLEQARRELGCAADALLMSCRIRNVRFMDVLGRGS